MTNNPKNLWASDQTITFAERWVKYWKAPGRPIPQEIDFLRKLISEKQKGGDDTDVLILGSTTEYRDLMFELGIKPTVVDLSEENYKILSKALKHYENYQDHEFFVEQKWQEISIDKKFDIVLGHFALTVNAFDTWDKILKSIHKHLKDDGLFITNNWISDGQKMSIDDIIKEYNEKWRKQYLLFGSMLPKIYEIVRNEKGEIHYPSICEIIDAAYGEGKISDEDYRYYINIGVKDFNFALYISSEEEFRQFVEKYFIIQDKVILDPYPNAYLMPEWVLKRKS